MNKWCDIPSYEGLYKINETGMIVNKEGSIMIPYKRGGYWAIELNKNGVGKKHSIARLVGLVFIPNPENKPYINHLNGNKLDNRKDNLEWSTAKENIRHAIDVLKSHPATNLADKDKRPANWGMAHKGKFNGAHPKARKVASFTEKGELIKRYNSISEAANELKINSRTIDKALSGVRKLANGKAWEYWKD